MANERRVRVNNCIGTLGATLVASTTTVQFSSAPNLPTIDSSKHAALVLEPDTTNEEIVYVTAYTAGQTTATVLRGQEGSTAIDHPANAVWVHGPTKRDNAAGRLAFARRTAGNVTLLNPNSLLGAMTNDAPVAHWRFNEANGATTLADRTGNGHAATIATGTYASGASLVPTDTDPGASNPTGAWYANVADTPSLGFTGPFTIEAWINSNTPGTQQGIVERYNGNNGYILRIEGGAFKGYVLNGAAVPVTGPAIVANTTYHVVLTYDGTNMRLYQNGVLVAGPTAAAAPTASTGPTRLFTRGDVPGFDLLGRADELALYNTALSAARVTAHYNAGTVASSTWFDVDTGLDLILPAYAGDIIEVGLDALLEGTSPDAYFDVASVVAAARVNYWGGSGGATDLGIPGWARAESIGNAIPASWLRQVVAADIDTAGLLLRLVARSGGRVLDATAARPLQFWAKNHGPQEA